jgi:hypothetical protein
MAKYLKTLDKEGNLVIHKIFGCEDCILMSYNNNTSQCKCRCFANEKDNILFDFIIIFYNDGEYVYEHIEIPKWCGLSNSLDDVSDSKFFISNNDSKIYVLNKIVYKSDEIKFLLPRRTFDHINYKDIFSFKVLAEDISYVLNYKSQSIDNIINKLNIIDNTNIIIKEDNSNIKKIEIKLDICSSCGEQKENVDRNVNLGMCIDCWNQNNNDETIKKQTFIKNFRLKRQCIFTNEQYKLV